MTIRATHSAAHNAQIVLVVVALAAALTLGWLSMRRHADHPAPMLPIDLFRVPLFALSAATAVCSFTVQGLAFVSLPFFFEHVLHRSQVETGLFMTPWPLIVGIMAPIAGRLSDRHAPGMLGGIGLVIVDYLQLMRAATSGESREKEIAEISRSKNAVTDRMASIASPFVSNSARRSARRSAKSGSSISTMFSFVRSRSIMKRCSSMVFSISEKRLMAESGPF